MSLKIDRPDGSAQLVYGYRYAAPGADAHTYRREQSGKLPRKVDLRPWMTEVEHQAAANSCVANAVAGAYEYLIKRHYDEDGYDVSRLFIYYNARAMSGMEEEDQGALIGDAIRSLMEHGACSEETWPYDVDAVNAQPPEEAYEEASQFLIEDNQLVPTELDAWKAALADGYPIIFGVLLYKSFDKHRTRGLVPVPSETETARQSHAGHAMLAVGYSDKDRVFIVRNSWGTRWGDEGYCYIPYDYLMNSKFNGGDSWIIRQVEAVEVDDEDWDDEESVVEDIGGALSEMSDEAWEALVDALGDTPLETRLAMIVLMAAGADGELSDDELDAVAAYLGDMLEELGSDYSARKVLKKALKRLDDEELVFESIELLGEHLPASALAGFLNDIVEMAGADELAEEEEDFINALVEAWQVEEA